MDIEACGGCDGNSPGRSTRSCYFLATAISAPWSKPCNVVGVRVTVISTISSHPPMIADELRRQADVFIDLMDLRFKFGRDPSDRPPPRGPAHVPQFLQGQKHSPIDDEGNRCRWMLTSGKPVVQPK